jgi:hypothetical protein
MDEHAGRSAEQARLKTKDVCVAQPGVMMARPTWIAETFEKAGRIWVVRARAEEANAESHQSGRVSRISTMDRTTR